MLFGFAIPSACGIGYHYIIYISRCYILCSFFLYFPFMFEMWAVSWILPNAIFRIGISTAFKNRTTQWTQKKNYQHNICVWTLNNCIKWKWFSPVHPGRHCVAVQIGSLVVASTTHIFKNIRKKNILLGNQIKWTQINVYNEIGTARERVQKTYTDTLDFHCIAAKNSWCMRVCVCGTHPCSWRERARQHSVNIQNLCK